MKVYCVECRKDFGGTCGNHSNGGITNLFANFHKNHIKSELHIRYYCQNKGIDWCNHLQATALKGKIVELTPADHIRLIEDGKDIVESVNALTCSKQKPFLIIGSLDSFDFVKSF
jgi:hypothetical protein